MGLSPGFPLERSTDRELSPQEVQVVSHRIGAFSDAVTSPCFEGFKDHWMIDVGHPVAPEFLRSGNSIAHVDITSEDVAIVNSEVGSISDLEGNCPCRSARQFSCVTEFDGS